MTHICSRKTQTVNHFLSSSDTLDSTVWCETERKEVVSVINSADVLNTSSAYSGVKNGRRCHQTPLERRVCETIATVTVLKLDTSRILTLHVRFQVCQPHCTTNRSHTASARDDSVGRIKPSQPPLWAAQWCRYHVSPSYSLGWINR